MLAGVHTLAICQIGGDISRINEAEELSDFFKLFESLPSVFREKWYDSGLTHWNLFENTPLPLRKHRLTARRPDLASKNRSS